MQVIDLSGAAGPTPQFMMRPMWEGIAKEWLDPNGQWTHIEGLDEGGFKMFDHMVRYGIVDKGEAIPDNGGQALLVYRLKAHA